MRSRKIELEEENPSPSSSPFVKGRGKSIVVRALGKYLLLRRGNRDLFIAQFD